MRLCWSENWETNYICGKYSFNNNCFLDRALCSTFINSWVWEIKNSILIFFWDLFLKFFDSLYLSKTEIVNNRLGEYGGCEFCRVKKNYSRISNFEVELNSLLSSRWQWSRTPAKHINFRWKNSEMVKHRSLLVSKVFQVGTNVKE